MSREVYRHQWMTCYETEQGIPYVFMNDGSMLVPVTPQNDVLFTVEQSVAYDERVLYLPGGVVEPGEKAMEAANRELQEEIGYKAKRLDYLGVLYPFIKYMQLRLHVFLARDLVESRLQGDEEWPIDVERTPLSAFEPLIESGRLRDSNVIAALYLARRFLQKQR